MIAIILTVVVFFASTKDLNKKYKEYGYTGLADSIKYDDWTGEIIPKTDLKTYNNSSKYIINSKGNKITIAQIEKLLKQYGEIQGNYISFSKNKKDPLDRICNRLLRINLDLDYEIRSFGEEDSDSYRFQIVGEYEDNYYSSFSSQSDLRGLVKIFFKDKYNKENNVIKQ